MRRFAWFFAPIVRMAVAGVVPSGERAKPAWACVVPGFNAWVSMFSKDFTARGITIDTPGIFKANSHWYVLPSAMRWLLDPMGGHLNTQVATTRVEQEEFDAMCGVAVHVLRRHAAHLPQFARDYRE